MSNTDAPKVQTVNELLRELKALKRRVPGSVEFKVKIEGCDGYGDLRWVNDGPDVVYLDR